jgi:phage baseplate assembly protein W
MVSDAADIGESLIILFSTTLGERVMQPEFGASLKEQLFEPLNPSTLTFIEDLLRTAIIYQEPRIEPEGLSIQLEPLEEEGGLQIEINARIRGTNSRFNFVYPFYRTETGQQP